MITPRSPASGTNLSTAMVAEIRSRNSSGRAGHAQATMTERYVHAAQVAFPGAAERAEERLFGGVVTS